MRRFCLLCLAVLCGLPVLAPAARAARDAPRLELVLEREQRSIIVLVEGEGALPADRDMTRARELAVANARAKALDKARAWHAAAHPGAKAKPRWPQSAQATETLAVRDKGVTDDVCRVLARIEVPFDLDAANGQAAGPDDPLSARLAVENPRKGEEDRLTLRFWANRDCHGLVALEMENGQSVKLLPNTRRPEDAFEGGRVYRIPDVEDQYSLALTGDETRESFLVLVTANMLGNPLGKAMGAESASSLENGLVLLPRVDSLGERLRQGLFLSQTEPALEGAEVYEALYLACSPGRLEDCRQGVVQRARGFRLENPQGPIDMTGSAGQHETLTLDAQ